MKRSITLKMSMEQANVVLQAIQTSIEHYAELRGELARRTGDKGATAYSNSLLDQESTLKLTCDTLQDLINAPPKQHQLSKSKALVKEWNKAYKVGANVRFWPGAKLGPGIESTTRTQATLLNGYTPVVWLNGYPGCVALSHVEAIVP